MPDGGAQAQVPGPVTKTLRDAFAARAGFDHVGQYLRFLGAGGGIGL